MIFPEKMQVLFCRVDDGGDTLIMNNASTLEKYHLPVKSMEKVTWACDPKEGVCQVLCVR